MALGIQAFLDEMDEFGLFPRAEAGLVICCFTPIDGFRAGSQVEVGVSDDELHSWPQMPPHWIHLPNDIEFVHTNAEPSPKEGWLKHSRDCPGWGDSPPSRCWIAHVQYVLGEAVG